MEPEPQRPVDDARKIYTVSELNALARDLLESSFFDVWVEGEISNLRSPGSGHLYFTLKDASAQLSAVLFRSNAADLRFRLEDGLKVVTQGRVSLYEARGAYQVICRWLEPAGRGSLQLAFEQLKRRLAEEGLFDPEKKKTIPALPQKIGVITSPTGAALRDFLHVVDRRYANIGITIHPARVQGAEAAAEIAEAVKRMNQVGDLDVLVLCRGGGSLEDLWPFNEEIVARAVAGSRIPIISAVGHEIDFTICDFVADFRAATPSAAAETVVAHKESLQERIQSLQSRLASATRLIHQTNRERVNALGRSRALLSARSRLDRLHQRLDDGHSGLQEGLRSRLRAAQRRMELATRSLSPHLLTATTTHRRQQTRHLIQRAGLSMERRFEETRQRLGNLAALLDSLSPLSILKRGFALCLDPETGAPVTHTQQLPPSGRVLVRLRRGQIGCDIREVHHARENEEDG